MNPSPIKLAPFKWLLILLGLSVATALWWQRDSVFAVVLKGLLLLTPLSATQISGVQVDLTQVWFNQLQFALQTNNGLISSQIDNARLSYQLKPWHIKRLEIDKLGFNMSYRPSSVSNQTTTFDHLNFLAPEILIHDLTLTIDTPAGIMHFQGQAEAQLTAEQLWLVTIKDSHYHVDLEINPVKHSLQLHLGPVQGKKFTTLDLVKNAPEPDDFDLQTDIKPLSDWLTTYALIPETIRKSLATALSQFVHTDLTHMQLTMSGKTTADMNHLQGHAVLTRQQRYLASSDLTLDTQGLQLTNDSHIDLNMAEFFSLIKPWLPESVQDWQFPTGQVMAVIRTQTKSQAIEAGELYLTAHNVHCRTARFAATESFLRFNIETLHPLTANVDLQIPHLRMGETAALEHLQFKARLVDNTLSIQQASLGIFDGAIDIMPTNLDIQSPVWPLTLNLQQVDLSKMIAALKIPHLAATGKLNAKLPLNLSKQSIEIQDGRLNAAGPGSINYQGPNTLNDHLAFNTLRDMRYHDLQGTLNYRPNGDYQLGLRIAGRNPKILSGHALAFNLNLSGRLPALLQKSIMMGDFQKPILDSLTPSPPH